MNVVSKAWQSSTHLFDPVQYFFNGNFWEVFCRRFSRYTNGKVIDLACGTGEMRNWIKPESYLGVDLNRSYIRYAKKRYAKKDTDFLVGDITKVKLNKRLSTAFIVSAVHHLSDKQLKDTFKNLKRQGIRNIVIVDGYPRWPFTTVLSWLDAVLAGGKYFRKENEIASLVKTFYKVKSKGKFFAKRSFYFYPFVIATYEKRQLAPNRRAKTL